MPGDLSENPAEQAPAPADAPTEAAKEPACTSFSAILDAGALDARLLQALRSRLRFTRATPVQQQTVPLALAGKDILARARTGSGKTVAYCLPVVQKVLLANKVSY